MVDRIIGIYGVPRSGTSWLGQIINSSEDVVFKFQPLFSYAFKNIITSNSSESDIEKYFECLINTKDDFLDQEKHKKMGIYPVFDKKPDSNILVYKEATNLYSIPIILNNIKRVKMIFIVRNPYNVIESWINAPSEFHEDWIVEDEWMFGQSKNEYRAEMFLGYYKWKEMLKMFCDMKRKYPNNVEIVQYENLVDNSRDETVRLFDFCELHMGEQTIKFLDDSQNKTADNVYSVYKKINGTKTKNRYLSEDIKEKIYNDLQEFKECYEYGYEKEFYKNK